MYNDTPIQTTFDYYYLKIMKIFTAINRDMQ